MLNKIKARLNNKKGFTLVELIVVIVIILILAAVLVPNVTKYVSNAREASFKSDASSILTQLQADCTANAAGTEMGTSDFGDDAKYKVCGKTTKKVTSLEKNTNKIVEYGTNGTEIDKFWYSDGTYQATLQDGSLKVEKCPTTTE